MALTFCGKKSEVGASVSRCTLHNRRVKTLKGVNKIVEDDRLGYNKHTHIIANHN